RTCNRCFRCNTIEAAGSVRGTLRLQGVFVGDAHVTLAHVVARLSFYAGSGLVELPSTLHNPRAATHPGGRWDLGDVGSVYFRDLAIHLALRTQNNVRYMWTPQPYQPLVMSPGTRLAI